MLDAHRQQPTGFYFKSFAIAIDSVDEAVPDALNILIKSRYRQATFLHGFQVAVEYLNFRVDEHPGFAVVLRQIHHDDLLVQAAARSKATGRIHDGQEW